jgi:lauroyl/myristoyl acyltransferase
LAGIAGGLSQLLTQRTHSGRWESVEAAICYRITLRYATHNNEVLKPFLTQLRKSSRTLQAR